MFAPAASELAKLQLTRCLRFWPHHADTGGFFVAVFVKPAAATAEASASNSRAESKTSFDEDIVQRLQATIAKDPVQSKKERQKERKEFPPAERYYGQHVFSLLIEAIGQACFFASESRSRASAATELCAATSVSVASAGGATGQSAIAEQPTFCVAVARCAAARVLRLCCAACHAAAARDLSRCAGV